VTTREFVTKIRPTHHDLEELKILGIPHFADVVEEDGELREVHGERKLRENLLELHAEQLHESI
jgi:hypothetical protein